MMGAGGGEVRFSKIKKFPEKLGKSRKNPEIPGKSHLTFYFQCDIIKMNKKGDKEVQGVQGDASASPCGIKQ